MNYFKHKAFLIAIFCATPYLSKAGKTELQVSFSTQISTIVVDKGALTLNSFQYKPDNNPIGVYLTAKNYISHWISIGLSVGIFNDHGILDIDFTQRAGTYTRKNIVIAPEVGFTYFSEKNIKLYSFFGFGTRITSEQYTYDPGIGFAYAYDTTQTKANKFAPIIQITPIAFRFGKNIGGFAEIGWGYKGIFNFGFFYKL